MENVCRLCLQSAYDLSSVFQYKSGTLVSDLIQSIIPEISIDRNDELSKLVCKFCIDIVLKACELRNTSIENDHLMRSLTAKKTPLIFTIKDEPELESVVKEEKSDNFSSYGPENDEVSIKECSVVINKADYVNYSKIRQPTSTTSRTFLISDSRSIKQEPMVNASINKIVKISRKFECPHCEKSYNQRGMLARHINQYHYTSSGSGYYFKCDICELVGRYVIFKLKSKLECHMTSCHLSESGAAIKKKPARVIKEEYQEFYCETCNKMFLSRFALYSHSRRHQQKILWYQCRMCLARFKRKNQLQEHMKKHEEKETTCRYCKLKFQTRTALRLHSYIHCSYVEEYHEPEPRQLVCSLCAFQSPIDDDLQRHLRGHESDFNANKILVCARCSWTFTDYDNLQSHTNEHNIKKTHRCLKCSKTFPFGDKLLRHLMRYNESYCCDMCGHIEPVKTRMEEHMRIFHLGEVCFLCPVCGESKSSSFALRSHLRSVHSDEKKYKCPLCPKSFRTPAYYRNHQSVHTTEAVKFIFPHCALSIQYFIPQSFQCQKCPKRFKGFRNLKRHQRFHDPSKLTYRYSCDMCDKKFYSNYAKKRHELSHTGIVSFICS